MATEISEAPRRGRGRPPTFDRATALGKAMELFWERGYEGTLFDDLIAAMGLSPSSFYNSFGNKERLYREAVDAYLEASGRWFHGEMEGTSDTRLAFRNVLERAAREFTGAGHPCGCMISLAVTHVPPGLASMREMMTGHRHGAEEAMAARIRRGLEEGDVPPDTDVEALAAFYSALARGMAVQARDGATTDRLLAIVNIAMNAWPAMA